MFSCNCLNIVIEIEKHDKTVKREDLLLEAQEQADEIFNLVSSLAETQKK